ncbi:MAG TPA: phosphopantetheine-binding protein, partial [Gemmatimonadales bacterium]|nr:phosphopantetheine-binding protein [Gemmatimonadales bacterium]
TGARLAPEEDLPALLLGQLTAPVRFTGALAAAGEADLWIEIGPGRALSELAAESLAAPAIPLDVGGPSISGLLMAAGAAFALGVPVDTGVLFAGRFARPFDPERPLKFLANPCETAPVDSPQTLTPGPSPVPSPLPHRERGTTTPNDLLRQLVAERAELPAEAVRDDSRLLSDLHLNSISVGQLVVEAARRLGLRPPASPTDYARATVAEVAEALSQQAPLGTAEVNRAPAGVDTWVRPFTVELVERPLAPGGKTEAAGSWRVIATPGHPLAPALSTLPGSGIALCLPREVNERHPGLFVEAARAALAAERPLRFLLVQEGGVGAAFARTLHLEIPETTVCVVELPFDHPDALSWITAEAAAASGYTEAHYDSEGVRRVPVLRLLPETGGPGELPLGPDDVLLVTGGGKGIAAECALDLARASGARLA